MESTGHPVKPWVNADNATDGAGNSQLRKKRLLTVQQKQRLRAQAQCQARQRRAENQMLAERAQRRWTEELEHKEQLRNMHTLHAAALQQAHQAQKKARIARQAAEQAEAAAHTRAAMRRADAKQRYAKAVSKVKTERQRAQERADSRSQRKARTRVIEEQRAAHQAKLAQATRRCRLKIDARRHGKAVSQPAVSAPCRKPFSPRSMDSLSLLRKQRATERGSAALRKACRQRRADELGRQLQRAEHVNQLFRKQHGDFRGPSPDALSMAQTQDISQAVAAPTEHQQVACAAQPTSGGSAAAARLGKPRRLAEQGWTFQRAPLRVVAQTQWQLKSLWPKSDKFITDNAGNQNSARAVTQAALHASLSSSKPFLDAMVRKGTPERVDNSTQSRATLRRTIANKQQADLPKAHPAAAQSSSQTRTAAVKQLQRPSTAKSAQKSGLRGHADGALPSLLPVLARNSTKKVDDFSVSIFPLRNSLLSARSHRRRPAVSPAHAVSPDLSSSAPAHPLSGNVHKNMAPMQASEQQEGRDRAVHAEHPKAMQRKPLARVDHRRQRPSSSGFPDRRAGSDAAGAVDAAQPAMCSACSAKTRGVRTLSPCPASEAFLWPVLSSEGLARAMPRAAHERQEGGTFPCASLDDVPRQALTVTPYPLLQSTKAAETSGHPGCYQKAGMALSAAEQNPQSLAAGCEQPGTDGAPRNSLSEYTVSVSHLETIKSGRAADQCAPQAGLAAETASVMQDIAAQGNDPTSLNAAAEQLQAVCRLLLQGLTIPCDLQSSLDAERGHHGGGVGLCNRGTDVLAGLVSDLEADMASA